MCAEAEKVRQLHLARLGDRARITERVVREVSKKHPIRRTQLAGLARAGQQSFGSCRSKFTGSAETGGGFANFDLDLRTCFRDTRILITRSGAGALLQLRLLQSTLQVKLAQFDQGRGRFSEASPQLRRR